MPTFYRVVFFSMEEGEDCATTVKGAHMLHEECYPMWNKFKKEMLKEVETFQCLSHFEFILCDSEEVELENWTMSVPFLFFCVYIFQLLHRNRTRFLFLLLLPFV